VCPHLSIIGCTVIATTLYGHPGSSIMHGGKQRVGGVMLEVRVHTEGVRRPLLDKVDPHVAFL